MANDLFGYISREIYPEVPIRYGPECRPHLSKFEPGRRLEEFAKKKYPRLKVALPQRLLPIFLNCRGSHIDVNEGTGSKTSTGQAQAAFDFILDFITTMEVSADTVIILAPYQGNVDYINDLRDASLLPPLVYAPGVDCGFLPGA